MLCVFEVERSGSAINARLFVYRGLEQAGQDFEMGQQAIEHYSA
jgi:hypothetical protein